MNRSASSSKLFALAVSEWLLVLPAALLLGGAALRQFQPPRNEPARTLSALLGWVVPRISHAGAAVLFLGLPAMAAIAGCVALSMAWRKSETLRQDTAAVLTGLCRHLAVAILGTGTLLAGAILAGVVIHIITD